MDRGGGVGALRWGIALTWGATIASFGCCPSDTPDGVDPSVGSSSPPLPALEVANTVVAKDLFASVAQCDVYHRGAVMDLGSPAAHGRIGYELGPLASGMDVVRDGATWARVDTGVLSLGFQQLSDEPVFVETRIRALESRAATVRIDGKVIGTLRLPRDGIHVVSTAATTETLAAGQHVLSFHFHRTKRDKPVAEIDWIRVGVPDQDPTTFAAPTLRDLATDTMVGGRPQRALALSGPGRVRCAVAATGAMSLQTILGYAGPGEGEARIEVVEPGKPAVLLHSTKLGGEGKTAEAVDLPLEGLAGRIVALDLVATATTPGGKILFGEPVLRVRDPRVPGRPEAKVVVLVVFTGANPSHLPGYADVPTMPALSSLLEESVVFHKHRAPTTVAAGSMASLLTGFSPSAHKVVDTGARLGDRFPTLGSIARDRRIATSMFTGNPTTFEAFGFDHGWNRFGAFSPVSGTSAPAPLREAMAWLDGLLKKDKDRPLLVVVHARGGHPPWTGTEEDFKDLPPKDYAGNLTGRRGGQILAKERSRHFGRKPMSAEDRVRVEAFAQVALRAEDAQLGQLVELLRQHKVWASTLLVVTSDIAMGGGARVPFGDGEALGEDVLGIPLVIRFPDRRFGGSRVHVPTTSMDVARTVLASMGLDPPDEMEGRDLLEMAAHPDRFGQEPQFAVTGSTYATRWGNWLLSGTPPRSPKFCELLPEQECSEDITAQEPFFASWAWRMTLDHVRSSETSMHPAPTREPATLDPDTTAALTVWGSLEPEPAKK
jgi:hypothetical protein